MQMLVYDTGIGLDHALWLGRTCGDDCRVYYYKEWHEPFPKIENAVIGEGFPEIIHIEDWGLVYDKIDYWFFTDSGYGSFNDLLRKHGKKVFGNSYQVERLELDRFYGKQKMEELGIPVTEYYEFHGLQDLMQFLEKHRGKRYFVKLSTYRGASETFPVTSPEDARIRLEQAGLGIYLDKIEGIVEPEAEGMEVGLDCFFNGREFVRPCFFTVEFKGHSTTGKWVYESIFDEFWLDKIEGFLKETGYRGNLSVEAFWDGSLLRVTDPTPRLPYPGSSLFPRMIPNYANFIQGVVDGEVVEFKPKASWGVEIGIYTDEPDYWRPIYYEGGLEHVGFRHAVNDGGKVWYVPGDVLVATANGWGSTHEEAWSEALKVAENIHAIGTYHGGHEQAKIDQYIRELRKLDVKI